MKYLAILKDSLREAIDTKVFFALVGLSLIVVLLVGSISYVPVDAETAFRSIVEDPTFRLVYAEKGTSPFPQMAPDHFQISEVKALTEASAPNAADHSFVLTVQERSPYSFHETVKSWESKPEGFADFHGMGKRESTTRVTDEQMTEFLKYQLWMAGNLDVFEVKKVSFVEPNLKAEPKVTGSYTFQIKTRGHAGVRGWLHDVRFLFGALTLPPSLFRTTLSRSVYYVQNTLIGGFGAWIGIILGVVITAFFIPNMLRKGTIDLLLVKPIHRPTLLVYKYIGGLTFVFLTSLVAVGGAWFVLGLRSGIWTPGFLLMVLVITFFFAILYSISTLFGVLTRSPIVAILVTCLVWFVLFLVGIGYQTIAVFKKNDAINNEIASSGWGWAVSTMEVIHFVLPRTADLNVLSQKMLAGVLTEGERKLRGIDSLPDISWGESLGVSLVFISLMLGLACWRFSRKDY